MDTSPVKGMQKGIKRRTKKNIPNGYDSWFEYDLHQKMRQCQYHTQHISYVQERKYEPDFIYKNILIEAKGRFRTRDEARKYVDVRKCLDAAYELVFIFMNPNTAMPGARKRADGTRYNMAEWADKQGFRYYTAETMPLEWSRKR